VRAAALAGRGPALATALAGRIGYDRAAEIAKKAHRGDRAEAALAVLPDTD
jgi:fumarate hydratase class II